MCKWYGVAGWMAVALWALPVRAETNATAPTELDIGNAWRLAYDHNPTLNRVRQRLVGQSGSLMVSESTRLPNIDAFGLYQMEDESRSGTFGGSEPPDDHYWRPAGASAQPCEAASFSARRSSRKSTPPCNRS